MHREAGYATLTIGMIMMVMISLISIYATRSGILDIRSSAHWVRHAEAIAMAEGRAERGIAWIMTNRVVLDPNAWTGSPMYGTCTSTDVTPPCGDYNTNRYGSNYRYRCYGDPNNLLSAENFIKCGRTSNYHVQFYLMAEIPPAGSTQTHYDIVTKGRSNDLVAEAVVKQGIYFYALGATDKLPAPFVAAGNITTGGNFNLVANPNGGGPGVPVSLWTPNDVANIGSASTCQIQEFTTNSNTCPASSALSSAGNIGPDIVDNAANFPADLFEYLFGVPSSNYQSIKNTVRQISNCNVLNSASKGIYWYSNTGSNTCAPSGDVGSATGPVILVVEDQDFNYTSNNTFYGIVFSFSPKTAGKGIKFAGTGSVRGSVITDNPDVAGQVIDGKFKFIYDPIVMGKFKVDHSYMGLAKLPGSWTDFLD